MTVATDQRIYLSESLQSLIDSRLETIERMLLGRVARAERMAIVREVESQIHELLGERETDELSREDVLAVLARLDPPEAYLPEEGRDRFAVAGEESSDSPGRAFGAPGEFQGGTRQCDSGAFGPVVGVCAATDRLRDCQPF